MSISYGECESENGATANASYVTAYEQAAAEGISVFVSSGDEGAASCDADETVATHGIAVSGFASTPYNVAVGGTDFADSYNAAEGGSAVTTYWNTSNTATYSSAKSYIPEIPWNDSCAGSLLETVEKYTAGYGSAGFCNSTTGTADYRTTAAGSGGPEQLLRAALVADGRHRPAHQHRRQALPAGRLALRRQRRLGSLLRVLHVGHGRRRRLLHLHQHHRRPRSRRRRDVLRVARAGRHPGARQPEDGCQAGQPQHDLLQADGDRARPRGTACNSNGGTAASPVLPASSCIFNDVTLGDIDVNCTGSTDCYGYSKSGRTTYQGVLSTSSTTLGPAFPATTGWDYATGLGTVNAANLVNEW